MNTYLANYLFGQETLYQVPLSRPDLPVPKELEAIAEKTLIETKPLPPNTEVPDISSIQLSHKVLILVYNLPENEKIFLGKVLSATGLSFEQVDLIELKKLQKLDYQSFVAQKITYKFISFGVGLSKLGWNMLLAPYQTKTIGNVDFLLTDELSKIEANINLKKSLWANLQKLFPKN